MPSKSVADLFADFQLRQKQKAFLNEEKMKSSRDITRLQQQKRVFLVEKLSLALQDKDTREIDGKIAQCEAQLAKAMQAEGLDFTPQCAACGDSGAVGRRYCTCFLRLLYRELYGAVDIESLTPSFETFDLSLFDNEQKVAHGRTQRQLAELAQKTCETYIDEFPSTRKPNILLTGKTGLGKSYMLHCMAKKAVRKDIDVLLIRAGELFAAFHAHRLGEEMPLTYLHDAALLFIDDLGTEPVTQNVSAEYLFDLINRRLETKKHTVIATNADDLKKRYDERISSRIESRQQSIMLLFDGQDLRLR